MANDMLELLARLDAATGVSGDESAVAEIIQDELAGAYDEHEQDVLGNHFFVKRGAEGAPTVMLCAHMDELGFVVQHVEDEGFVRIAQVGYHDARMVVDQDLRIHGENGPVDGVTGAKPAHLLTPEERAKAIPLEELFVDVGTASRAETEALGVRVGQLASFARTGRLLNGTRLFTGKAVDDRAGCAVMVEVMRRLGEREPGARVVATAAVQEELGIRGAGPAALRVQPDVALAIDVTLCGDTPGMELARAPIRMGEGPAIKYFDWAPDASDRQRRSPAPDAPARGGGRSGRDRLPARGADGRRDRRVGHRAQRDGRARRLRIRALPVRSLGGRLRQPRRPRRRGQAHPRVRRGPG